MTLEFEMHTPHGDRLESAARFVHGLGDLTSEGVRDEQTGEVCFPLVCPIEGKPMGVAYVPKEGSYIRMELYPPYAQLVQGQLGLEFQ